ncbi:signal peptidase II [Deinococcus sp. KNUC1210]|uniref:signal peptidase II n=1 Tax=Deinococcus sp. KNUC1210 TaxID=2917691 RepID=UPI001EEFAE22|nr:signal peptidase II [Deinococcus sp. KNUC1210]ULH14353.1 signal peptidase II [Deinococcus sp. KNUC1210]
MSTDPFQRRRLPGWIPLLLAVLLVGADQALKAWARTHLTYGEAPIPFIPGLLSWQLTYNTGAAWSLLSGSTAILAGLRLIVGLGILVYLFVRPQPRAMALILGLIAAGAVGNTIDGLFLGRVTDMLYSPALSVVTRSLRAGEFPIFNIADSCVVLGTLLLIVLSFVPDRRTGNRL